MDKYIHSMKKTFMGKVFTVLVLMFSVGATAGQPTCQTYSGVNYCAYTGPVQKLYINADNLILLYFDTAIDPSVANSFGMAITNGSATAYRVDDNPEFAKLFYSTALAAQASGREVTIQMRGVEGGYLNFDRIWLAKP